MKLTFTVYGHPEPAGSKQAMVPLDKRTKQPYRRPNGGIVVSVIDDNPKSRAWKKTVATHAHAVFAGPKLAGPLAVELRFFRARPKSHFGMTGMNKVGRTTPYPITKPDALKLGRAVEDALTGIVFFDDAQIVGEYLSKEWGNERVEISVEQLDPTVEQPALIDDESVQVEF